MDDIVRVIIEKAAVYLSMILDFYTLLICDINNCLPLQDLILRWL